MRWAALVVMCACASSAPRGPAYPLHPKLRSASGGPIEMLGFVNRPGPIPYATGITLTCALRLVGGPTAAAARYARLQRGHRLWHVPVQDIVDGTAPDIELAPGDVVVFPAID